MLHAVLALVLSRWLVLSDVHLDPYARGAHITYGRDTNPALLRSAIAAMRAHVPNPQVVVIGGDMLAHHFGAHARAHGQQANAAGLAATRAIVGALARAYPHAQFLVTLGNNDDPCGDYRSEAGGAYQRALARIYAPLVDRNGSAPRFVAAFTSGGYYAVTLPNGVHAVVLNTVLDSIVFRGSCRRSAGDPARAQTAWLAGELARSPRAVLLMHIPPGIDATSTVMLRNLVAVPFMRSDAQAGLIATLRANAKHIAFGIAAHTHRYDVRLAGGVPLLIVSSVSPIYRNNPAFFELRVAADGTLRDVTPYAYDPKSGAWHLRPSFDAAYGARAFDVASVRALHGAIARDQATRARWMAAYDAWSGRVHDIGPGDWRIAWCAQSTSGAAFAACAGTMVRDRIAAGALGLAMAILVLGVLAVRRRHHRA